VAVGPDPISSALRRSSPPFVLRPRSNRLVVDAGANVDAIAAPSWTRAQKGSVSRSRDAPHAASAYHTEHVGVSSLVAYLVR
jgi:hypothetical protein